ncbi:Sof1 domain-containing U3 snoRNP protein [Pseudoloma neurophilia]|uniref:Sof1 domain-containing U3 snoRNP protein n=1 Tax=Pseudoloma neurophilia TaxID=146866 RepID=A0A0R0LT60_9MICR|nr:Sof1 domain-containing U3 snoRNP protein [Pseudoloma neurophilia]
MKIYAITRTGKNAHKKEYTAVPNNVSFRKVGNDPLAAQKEFIQALNATKIERLLAKPFIKNIDSFSDNIIHLDSFGDICVSAAFDGEISVRKGNDQILHANIQEISDLSIDQTGLYMAIKDKVYRFEFNSESNTQDLEITSLSTFSDSNLSISTVIQTNCPIKSLKRQKKQSYVLTDSFFSIHDENYQTKSKFTFKESYEKLFAKNQIVYCTSERDLNLIDERSHELIISKQYGIKTNDIAFKDNQYFITANENAFAYMHDIRKLETPIAKFIGHVNSLTSVDFYNDDIVTGSCDKSIRIFNNYERTSRDVYYNKRMLSVSKVKVFKGRYILSGSDDANVRLWRLNASQKEKLSKAERESLDEKQILKEKYYHVGDIKRIDKHRFLPGDLKSKIKQENEHHKAVIRKKKRFEEQQ